MAGVMELIAEYRVVLAGAGALGLLSMACCYLLNRMEWLSIWNKLYPIGKVFDKFLQLKFRWLESLVENVGILGVVPAAISLLAGMTENNIDLKATLKKILTEMAAKV